MAEEKKGLLDRATSAVGSAAANVYMAADSGVTAVGNTVTGNKNKSISQSLEELGVKGDDKVQLLKEINKRQNISDLLDKNSAAPASAERDRVAKALIDKWRSNPALLANLDRDLGVGGNRAKVEQMLTKEPAKLATLVGGYDGNNMNTLLNAPTAPARTGPAPTETKRSAEKVEPTVKEPKHHKSAAHVEPIAAAVKAEPAVAAPVASQPVSAEDKALFKQTFASMAKDSDQSISESMNSKFVKGMAGGIAEQASKLGVDDAHTKSFTDRIDRDPVLRQKIADNLKNNPGFVREMAKMAGEKDGSVPDSMKEMARKTMVDVMENPEKLADEKYVKNLSSGMSMKSSMGGGFGDMFKGLGGGAFGGMFGDMFKGLGGFFQGLMDKVSTIMEEVSNGQWLSRRNSGRNFFGAFTDALSQTPARLESEAKAKQDMVVHPMLVNGKYEYGRNEPVMKDGKPQMGDDGKPLTRYADNSIEVTTTGGKTYKALPATGARVEGPNNLSQYQLTLVTATDKDHNPTEVHRVVISAEEYIKYKGEMTKYGDPNNPPQVITQNDFRRVTSSVTSLNESGQPVKTEDMAERKGAQSFPIPDRKIETRQLDPTDPKLQPSSAG